MSKPPRMEGRVLDESSPEAQAIFGEFDLETMERKEIAEFKRRMLASTRSQSGPPEADEQAAGN